jgi:hypothetical protein
MVLKGFLLACIIASWFFLVWGFIALGETPAFIWALFVCELFTYIGVCYFFLPVFGFSNWRERK